MTFDLVTAVVIWLTGYAIFGRFVVPRWKVWGKLAFYLVVSMVLSRWVGHWSLIWIVGHPLLGIWGHWYWCRNNGISWLTCEPRDRYLELRPWATQDGFAKKGD